MAVEIVAFPRSKRSLNDSITSAIFAFTNRLYRIQPRGLAPDKDSIARALGAHSQSAQRTFFAYDTQHDAKHDADFVSGIVATVTASVSSTLTDRDGQPVGLLGLFHAMESPEPVKQLFHAATKWLRSLRCRSIVGPVDGSTWHSYRINVGPFDENPHNDGPFLLEPQNPNYYSHLFLGSGFEVVQQYRSLRVDDILAASHSLLPSYESASNSGYTFRSFDSASFESELKTIYELSKEIFRENFLYEDISWREFSGLYQRLQHFIREELIWFAVDREGNEVGFLFAMPDYFNAVRAMKGKRNWIAKIRFTLKARQANTINFKSVGVIPSHRRNRLASAMMYLAYAESHKKGFRIANLCLIGDGNCSARLDGGNSRILRRYELYQMQGSRLVD
ncbi:MAG: hypothetical protein AB8B55_15300 [Mariniblastus sp.]